MSAGNQTISFDIDGSMTRSQLLHKLASGIQGEGLQPKRIMFFETPFTVRIYVEGARELQRKPRRLSGIFSTRDPIKYTVDLSICEFPLFNLMCAYIIEREGRFRPRKPFTNKSPARVEKHIIQSVSESLVSTLETCGAKILPAISQHNHGKLFSRLRRSKVGTHTVPWNSVES